jgi:ATP synthase protein I
MSEQQRPPSFNDFDARLAKARPEKKGGAGDADMVPQRLQFGSGLQAGIEVVAGVGAGLLLGWGLDYWLGTMPLFLIVFFMLGAAAGVLNAYRHLRRMGNGQDGR